MPQTAEEENSYHLQVPDIYFISVAVRTREGSRSFEIVRRPLCCILVILFTLCHM